MSSRANEMLGAFRDMNALELSDFVKAFETTFGVKASVPSLQPQSVVDIPSSEPVEEKEEFDVILTGIGSKKIQVIKEIRALTNLGLKDSKDLVESAPCSIMVGVSKETAIKAKTILERSGAIVTMK